MSNFFDMNQLIFLLTTTTDEDYHIPLKHDRSILGHLDKRVGSLWEILKVKLIIFTCDLALNTRDMPIVFTELNTFLSVLINFPTKVEVTGIFLEWTIGPFWLTHGIDLSFASIQALEVSAEFLDHYLNYHLGFSYCFCYCCLSFDYYGCYDYSKQKFL